MYRKVGRTEANPYLSRTHQRSECNQVGSNRESFGVMFRRYDAEDLVRKLWRESTSSRPAGTFEGNLHHKMVTNRTQDKQSKCSLGTCIGILRFHCPSLGRRSWHQFVHIDQAHRTSLFCGLFS